jgi:predicted nucleic acid-binding Zn ribbon protein
MTATRASVDRVTSKETQRFLAKTKKRATRMTAAMMTVEAT